MRLICWVVGGFLGVVWTAVIMEIRAMSVRLVRRMLVRMGHALVVITMMLGWRSAWVVNNLMKGITCVRMGIAVLMALMRRLIQLFPIHLISIIIRLIKQLTIPILQSIVLILLRIMPPRIIVILGQSLHHPTILLIIHPTILLIMHPIITHRIQQQRHLI